MNIHAHDIMFTKNKLSVIFSFEKGDRHLSIVADNGITGKLPTLSRADIRLYDAGNDVTQYVIGTPERWSMVAATEENFAKAWDWVREG